MDEHVPITQERRPLITIEDLGAVLEVPLDTVPDLAVSNLMQHVQSGTFKEAKLRREYSLNPTLPLDEALREHAVEALNRYRDALAEKSETFRVQIEHCAELALSHCYLETIPPITLRVSDKFLFHALPDADNFTKTNFFNDKDGYVSAAIDAPNKIVAHEVGHLLSFNNEEQQTGFQPVDNKGEHWAGIQALNEGVTVLWEEFATNDGSEVPQRYEEFDLYTWSKDTVRAVLSVIARDEDFLFRAYFGKKDAREEFARLIAERFGTSIEELFDCLSFSTDFTLTQKILSGEPVEVTINALATEQMAENKFKLATIFPNVRIIDKR